MKRVLTLLSLMLFSAGMFAGVSVSAQEEDTMYLYGTVSQTSDDTITVTEIAYDEETGDEIYLEDTYSISPEAELENIESITMLEAGDEIEIEYVEKGGGNEIQYLFVYADEE